MCPHGIWYLLSQRDVSPEISASSLENLPGTQNPTVHCLNRPPPAPRPLPGPSPGCTSHVYPPLSEKSGHHLENDNKHVTWECRCVCMRPGMSWEGQEMLSSPPWPPCYSTYSDRFKTSMFPPAVESCWEGLDSVIVCFLACKCSKRCIWTSRCT